MEKVCLGSMIFINTIDGKGNATTLPSLNTIKLKRNLIMSKCIYTPSEQFCKENYHPISYEGPSADAVNNPGFGGITPTSFKPGHKTWNKGKKCRQLSENKKRYWAQWKLDNPGYKDKWKRKERKNPEDIVRADNTTPLNKTIIECPHCNKTGNVGNMKRWHFDKCKKK